MSMPMRVAVAAPAAPGAVVSQPLVTSKRRNVGKRLPRGAGKTLIGGGIVVAVVLVTLASPMISPFDPNQQSLAERLRPPFFLGGDARHLLGTDQLGRDLLSRLFAAGRISLAIAGLAVLASTLLGTVLGLLAAYYGRFVDA